MENKNIGNIVLPEKATTQKEFFERQIKRLQPYLNKNYLNKNI